MSDDRTIGQRIRTERLRRGKSLAVIAGQAELSVGHLSKMERGLERCDRRSTLARIASALGVPVSALTGQPPEPTDTEQVAAQSTVPALRLALMNTDLEDPDSTNPSRTIDIEELRALTARIADLRQVCDYAAVGAQLPDLLNDLHAASAGADRATALRLLVQACQSASLHAKDIGHADLAWIAAERGYVAARLLDEPVLIAEAQFSRAHSLFCAGAYERGGRLAQKAVAATPRDTGEGLQVYGMHCLTLAFAAVSSRRPQDAEAPLAEAAAVAEHTGQGNAFWHSFGPANVQMWRISMAVEDGDGGRAVELARQINADVIPAASRRAAYWIDLGRAHAQLRGAEQQSLQALRRAEVLAPQRARANPFVRDTVAVLLRRMRSNAAGVELQRMASRFGVS